MQNYQALKQYWLDLLIKSNLHEKKVWIVPKDGRTKPHWRTVRVGDDEPQTNPKMKKQDNEAKGRTKKQDENINPRSKKLEETPNPRNKKQDNKSVRNTKQDTSNAASTKSDTQTGQRHWNTMKIPKAIKQAANDHLSKFGSRDEFLKDLKDKGITWNEHSHAGINHMRAMMALNAAIMNESHGFKSPFGDSSSIQSDSSQSAQDKPSTQQKGTSKSKAPTGKVSKESKAKTHEFFMSCADREEFYSKLKQLGVKWTENDHPAINFMRAKMALSLKVENGFDPNNPPATDEAIAQQNGIISTNNESSVQKTSTSNRKSENKQAITIDNSNQSTQDVTNKKGNPQGTSSKLPRNYDSGLGKELGSKFYDRLRDIIDKPLQKYEELKTVWFAHEKDIKIDVGTVQGYCYNPKTNKLLLQSIEDIFDKPPGYNVPGAVIPHEVGHFIDFKYKDKQDRVFSVHYKNGQFARAIQADVKNLLKSAGIPDRSSLLKEIRLRHTNKDVDWFVEQGLTKKDSDLYKDIQTGRYINYTDLVDAYYDNSPKIQKFKEDFCAGDTVTWYRVADIISGGSNGDIIFPKGSTSHTRLYWRSYNSKYDSGISMEAFAEITETIMTNNKKGLSLMKKVLPNTLKIYHKMISFLAKEVESNENK